jgi:hypothetical protein
MTMYDYGSHQDFILGGGAANFQGEKQENLLIELHSSYLELFSKFTLDYSG